LRAKEVFEKARELGCGSFHVGAWDPILDLEGFKSVLAVAKDAGLAV
jgi:hypothetical protein